METLEMIYLYVVLVDYATESFTFKGYWQQTDKYLLYQSIGLK